jgi:2-haloacid dehalogenase
MTGPAPLALVFDVQGTLLDFYTPVRHALTEALSARKIDADMDALTNAWRGTYFTGMQRVTGGEREFVPTRTIYREGLDEILAGVPNAQVLTTDDRDALTDIWTRLSPWPDTAPGLQSLRQRHILATLTNGSMSATIATAAKHDLAFHAILSTELVRTFKPAPETYRLALDCLGLPPDRVMMVASHPYDLDAARSQGMRTAFIERPLEFGPVRPNDAAPPEGTDIVATSIVALATNLAAD